MSKPQHWTPRHSVWAKLPPKPKVRPEYETILNYDIRQYNYIPQSDKGFFSHPLTFKRYYGKTKS